MRSTRCKAFILALLLAGFGISQAKAGSILRVFYDGIPGTTVASLLNATNNTTGQKVFPDGPNADGSPLQSEWVNQYFEGSQGGGSNFGSYMRGFIEAPQTGDYIFWIASDDASELWISSNNVPANLVKIAAVAASTGSREWTKEAGQKSAAIRLERGKSYYIEAIHKQGTGSANLAVGWQLPDGTLQRPVPAVYLQPWPLTPFYAEPSIITQPQDVNVQENTPVVFFVDINGTPTGYQWYRGVTPDPTAPIADGVLSSYGFTAQLSDNNSTFKIVVGTTKGLVVSRTATLKVSVDNVPPTIASASSSLFQPDQVAVTFSEPVTAASAGDAANYTLDQGVMIYAAVVQSPTSVVLYTSRLNSGVNYTLTAIGVKDLSSVPNASNSQFAFSFTQPIEFKIYDGVSGTSTNDAINNASYQSGDYSRVIYVTNLEAPQFNGDNYIGQLQAFLVPPVTGKYTFYIASDDQSTLYLSTDESAANKAPIATVTGTTNYREYKKFPVQKSAQIQLEAGKKYYIEALQKEGTGSDNLSVTWEKPGDAAVANNAPPIPGANLLIYRTLGSVVVTNQPQSLTVMEGQPAKFSITPTGVQGTPPFTYQWYKNGIAIPGATNYSYAISRTVWSDNGAAFTVMAKNNFSLGASGNAILTLTPDTVLPTVAASGLYSNLVSLRYSEPINTNDATDLANYILKSESGTVVAVTNATVVDEFNINLGTELLPTGGRYNLTVQNVRDQANVPNPIATTNTFVGIYNFAEFTSINNTQAWGVAPGGQVTIQAGGADIWGNADQFVYGYHQLAGDFDFRLKVAALDKSDNNAKAGLMARVSLAAGSRNVAMLATPAGGANNYTFQVRTTTDGTTSSTGAGTVAYPNVWVRLTRVGSVFYGFYSADGLIWNLVNKNDTAAGGAYPASVYVGIAVTSHSTGATTKAVVSDYGPAAYIPITFTTITPNFETLEKRTASFSVTVAGTPPFFYQWQKNGVDIPGATGSSYMTPLLDLSDSGSIYRCAVTNPNQTVFSNEAKVTVLKDSVAPSIVNAAALWGGKFLSLQFDETVDSASASALANYTIKGIGSPYRGSIASATLRPNGNVVVLALTLPVTTNMQVVAKSVKDLPGNNSDTTNVSEVVRMTSKDIGTFDQFTATMVDPKDAGAAYVTSPKEFEVVAGGTDILNKVDGFHFVYEEVEGDFDLKVRVESLQLADNLSKAGLMVRENTSEGSRNLNMVVTPASPGNNTVQLNWRTNANELSAAWPGTTPAGPVNYPYMWLRLIRQGGSYTALSSVNGISWSKRAVLTPSTAYTNTLVGMATTSHNNTGDITTAAQYRDFEVSTLGVAPQLVSLVGAPTLTRVTVGFTLPVDGNSALATANYSLSGGLTISGASLDSSGKNVTLVTSAQTPGSIYTLTVNNVIGKDGIPMLPNARLSFSANVLSLGFLVQEVWNGIGAPLSNLKGSSRFPNYSDRIGYLSQFEAPVNAGDVYSQKVYGFVAPLVTGNYTFYVAASSQAELYLSTDNNPANKTLIAGVVNGTGVREWNKESGQKSAPIALEAGKAYYIEALQADAYTYDNLAVTWATPGEPGTPPNGNAPIYSTYLASYANPDIAQVQIVFQPRNTTTVKNQSVTFAVAALANYQPTIYYQWQKQPPGRDWMDIYAATGNAYQTARTSLDDNGTKYRVRVSVPGNVIYSSEALLTVVDDVVAPKLVSATSVLNSKTITLKFNEKMDVESATIPQNYVIFGGWDVLDAALLTDGVTVVLTTDKALTKSVVVWAWNATDLAGNPADAMMATQVVVLSAAYSSANGLGLAINKAGDNLVISWPLAESQGYLLESGSLAGSWRPVETPVVIIDDKNTVTVPIEQQGATTYRLVKGDTSAK